MNFPVTPSSSTIAYLAILKSASSTVLAPLCLLKSVVNKISSYSIHFEDSFSKLTITFLKALAGASKAAWGSAPLIPASLMKTSKVSILLSSAFLALMTDSISVTSNCVASAVLLSLFQYLY
nr:hypothetical protein [Sphingobacterium sp. UBA1498]